MLGGTCGGVSSDLGEGTIQLNGTFIPAYGVNNLFGRVPARRQHLGGAGAKGGLIGVTFRLAGPIDDPTLLVKPDLRDRAPASSDASSSSVEPAAGSVRSRSAVERHDLGLRRPKMLEGSRCLVPDFNGAVIFARLEGCAMGQVLYGSATTTGDGPSIGRIERRLSGEAAPSHFERWVRNTSPDASKPG